MRKSFSFGSLFLAAALSGCGNGAGDVQDFDWKSGETWHVAASYRVGNVKTENISMDLEAPESPVGDWWSEDVVWQYQVVETGLKPSSDDPLYEYAQTRKGVAKLAVVKAFIDTNLTDVTDELVEADPVVYFVFREDRDRLAAIIQFVNQDGERLEQAWSTKDLGRSYSKLSQSMLTAAPSYLAPVGTRNETGERKLENGHLVTTESVDDVTYDVTFEDSFGSGLVSTRYQAGFPWPTFVASDNLEARLLGDDEVETMRRARANGPALPPPADYDFRAALASSIDLDGAFVLDEDTIANGWDQGAPEGYEPWNGSWWPQSKGDLVFGYDNRDTVSDELRADIDPLKAELDRMNDKLRDLEEGSEEYNNTLEEYRTKQSAFVDKLVEFYSGLLNDMDGGKITVTNGTISHSEDGWSYDLNELSPMDKQAVALYYQGKTYPNPWYGPAWELLNHYSPEGGSWWGHCNGWAGAAILTEEPTESVTVDINGNQVEYTTADIKGLLSETHYSTYSRFYGARYYKEGDDLADLYPDSFHKIITHYFRDQQVPLVFDTTASDQVWNFPAYRADVEILEVTQEGLADLVNINTADVDALDALPGIGETLAGRIIDYREDFGAFQSIEDVQEVRGIGSSTYSKIEKLITVDNIEREFVVDATVYFATDGVDETHVDNGSPEAAGFVKRYGYTLFTDENGLVLRGTWDDDNEHPDFAWVPYTNPTGTSSSSSENPYLGYGDLVNTIGSFDRH